MPFKGYICDITHERISPDECHACARAGAPPECPMTAPVVAGMTASIRHLDGYSATETLGCLRKVRLEKEYDYWLKPSELYWAFRGQLMHGIAERYTRQDPDTIAEKRYQAIVFLDADPISGMADLVYRDRQHIVDFKTTKKLPGDRKVYRCVECGEVMKESEWVIRKSVKTYHCPHCSHPHDYQARQEGLTLEPPSARSKHVEQVNVYAWILSQHGITITSGEVVYMDMSGMLRVPVEIWPLHETQQMVERAYDILLRDELPAPVTDEDETWQCDYCPVCHVCHQLLGQEV